MLNIQLKDFQYFNIFNLKSIGDDSKIKSMIPNPY